VRCYPVLRQYPAFLHVSTSQVSHMLGHRPVDHKCDKLQFVQFQEVATGNIFGLRVYKSFVLLPSSSNPVGSHIKTGHCTHRTNLPLIQNQFLRQYKSNSSHTFKVTLQAISSNTSSQHCVQLQCSIYEGCPKSIRLYFFPR
jgi:hypothetical protein